MRQMRPGGATGRVQEFEGCAEGAYVHAGVSSSRLPVMSNETAQTSLTVLGPEAGWVEGDEKRN